MTSEDDFQKALDANPTDWQTRLVFADWLEERGDVRAEGYRALGRTRYYPYVHSPPPDSKDAWRGASWWCPLPDRDGYLPRDWYEAIEGFGDSERYKPLLRSYADIASRRQMDDAAARAFAKLPPERKAEILAAPPHEHQSGAAKEARKPKLRA